MFVIFDRLTLMSALFPPGKTLCSWCLLHTHFQSWDCSISPPNFMDFLGHRKSWNRRNFCRVSHLNKNIGEKKVHPFFTSFLDNLKLLKVIFAWLTLMSALFPYGKILCPWCFSSHQLSLMEKLCTRFPALGKLFTCVYHTVRLQSWESSVWPLSLMDFLGHRKSKNRRNLCRVSHLNKNIGNKMMCILSQVFWRISSRYKFSLCLLSCLHFSRMGKLCVHGVFLHTGFPWWENLAPTFLPWGKLFIGAPFQSLLDTLKIATWHLGALTTYMLQTFKNKRHCLLLSWWSDG